MTITQTTPLRAAKTHGTEALMSVDAATADRLLALARSNP